MPTLTVSGISQTGGNISVTQTNTNNVAGGGGITVSGTVIDNTAGGNISFTSAGDFQGSANITATGAGNLTVMSGGAYRPQRRCLHKRFRHDQHDRRQHAGEDAGQVSTTGNVNFTFDGRERH